MNSPPPPSRGTSATGVMSGIPFSGVPVGSAPSPSLSTTSGVSPSSMPNSGGGGVGATQKHLEFQLQRERGTVGSLQEKIKALHAQVAQLEQEKAELRREKISMAEENRKNSRAEEHWSTLKKDLDAKEKVCKDERQRAAEAKAETEEVRRKAQHSIAQWLKAESSWGEREAALQAQLKELGERYQKIQEEEEMLRREKNTIDASFHREREKAQKAEQRCVAMERDIQMQGEQLEKHQNKAFSYETEIAALRRSAAQLQDAMEQREAERHGWQLEQDRLVKENEQLAHTISTYQDRLNKEKTVQMNLSQEKALQDCDVQNAKKEAQHLTRLLESERKECALAQQREAQLAGEMEEWKSRLQVAKNELKTKETLLREKVLLTTQLQMEVQKGEAQMTLQKAEAHQRGLEMEQMTVTLHTQQQKTERIEEALTGVQTQLESAHQEVAMLREQRNTSQAEQAAQLAAHQAEMEDLQKNLSARQEVVEALTTQLQSLNQQQSHLHSCLEKNSISAHHQLSQQQLLQEAWREKEACFGLHAGVERVSLLLEGLLHPLIQSTHRAEEAHHLAMEQCTDRFTRLEEDYHRLVADHSDAQERLEMLLEENDVLRQQCEVVWSEKEKTWNETERVLRQQILTLQEEKDGAVGTAAERAEAMAAMHQTHQAFVEEKVQHVQAEWMHRQQLAIGTALESCESLFSAVMQRKVQYVWESACFLTQRAVREACTRREKQASLEEKCAGVEQLLSESNDLLRQQHQHSEETFHSLHAQLQKLEEKLALSQRESHLAQNQLQCTVEHWQQSKKEWDERLATQAAEFQHRLTRMTDEIQRVRKGLQYELARKTEYKVALERVKRYRAEEENHHFGVKEAVTRETEKANEEILYWREQYQLLKHTFQDLKRRHRAGKKAGITEKEEEKGGESRGVHSSSSKDSPSPSFSPSPPPHYFSTSPPRNVENTSAEGPHEKARPTMKKTKEKINSESGYNSTSPSASPQVPSRLTLSLEPVSKRARKEGENAVDPATAAETAPFAHPQETKNTKKEGSDHEEGKHPPKEVETGAADQGTTMPPPALRPLFSTSPPPTTGASSFPSTTLPSPSGAAHRSAGPVPPPSLSPRGGGGHGVECTVAVTAPVSPTAKEMQGNASRLPSTTPQGGAAPSPSAFSPPPPPASVVDGSTTQWRERHGLRGTARTVPATSFSPSPHPREGEEPRFWRTTPPLQREGAVERVSVVSSSAASVRSSAMRLGARDPNRAAANEKVHSPVDPIPVAFERPPASCGVGENGDPNHFPPYPYPHRGPGGRGRIGSTPPPEASSFSTSPPPSSPLQRP